MSEVSEAARKTANDIVEWIAGPTPWQQWEIDEIASAVQRAIDASQRNAADVWLERLERASAIANNMHRLWLAFVAGMVVTVLLMIGSYLIIGD